VGGAGRSAKGPTPRVEDTCDGTTNDNVTARRSLMFVQVIWRPPKCVNVSKLCYSIYDVISILLAYVLTIVI
uniref:Neur_chan_memb domain-containing protein n=1 Tax=Mesocestoides corti TaxID=53468 RepID=A0A5K3FXW2_MESCO